MFDLPVTGVLQPIPDASSPAIRTVQDTYGVTVTFKQRARTYMTTVVVRGTVCKAKAVKEATRVLIEQMTGKHSVSVFFCKQKTVIALMKYNHLATYTIHLISFQEYHFVAFFVGLISM